LQGIDQHELTPIQQIVMDCVRDEPGQWSRSSLAKLLVGSKSSRSGAMVDQQIRVARHNTATELLAANHFRNRHPDPATLSVHGFSRKARISF